MPTPAAETLVNRIRHLLPDADGPAKSPAELARARAAVFDAAVLDAIRTMQDFLASPDGKTRFAAASAILDLKQVSMRHKAEVFDEPHEPALPPLETAEDVTAGGTAEDDEEE